MPRLTILICTHDRAELLDKALRSLAAAERPAGWTVDVLVAANACRDGTHALLAARAADGGSGLSLSWFAEPTPGKSHALNSAMPRIQGDLVAFVDDDHRVDQQYLSAMCRAADEFAGADLFCGRIVPDWDGTEPTWVHDTGPYRVYPLPVPHYDIGDRPRWWADSEPMPGGGNLFLRTSWLKRIGPFATELGPTGHDLTGSEDKDWVLRALDLGARIRYVPQVVQYHYVDAARLTLGYVMKKAYKRSASSVAAGRPSDDRAVPAYLYRKVAEYAFRAITALGQARRRFYLVRTAAAFGEMVGHRQRTRRLGASTTTTTSN
jgi:glycosyltransferase involved in cell wall biosynthesis